MIDSTNPRILADNIRALSGASGSQASDISALQDAVEALGTYSTEEIDTGIKYLGETVYRKVFDVEALPNATTMNIAHGVSNLGLVFNLRGIVDDEGGTTYGRPIPFSTTLLLNFSAINIVIAATTDWSTRSAKIIFEYTKAAAPSPDLSPAPDDTRSIETEVREEEPIIDEPIEEPVVEVKKTTRKKTTTE